MEALASKLRRRDEDELSPLRDDSPPGRDRDHDDEMGVGAEGSEPAAAAWTDVMVVSKRLDARVVLRQKKGVRDLAWNFWAARPRPPAPAAVRPVDSASHFPTAFAARDGTRVGGGWGETGSRDGAGGVDAFEGRGTKRRRIADYVPSEFHCVDPHVEPEPGVGARGGSGGSGSGSGGMGVVCGFRLVRKRKVAALCKIGFDAG